MLEALSLSKFKSMLKDTGNTTLNDNVFDEKISLEYRERYKDWFGGKWRVYIPLSSLRNDPCYNSVSR